MDYRSDVGICLSKSAYDLFQKSLTNIKDNTLKKLVNYLLSLVIKISRNNSGILFYWKSIKWSDLNPECVWVDDFLNTLNDDEFLKIIIGEDYNDIEIRGNYWNNPFNMSIERRITFLNTMY